MEPMVCELLRSGVTFDQLYAEHGVKVRPYNGKASLCYDQIDTRDDDTLAQQCRGLVLEENTWRVLAWPFDRFFNLGQGAAAKLDWGTTQYEEKHDGTLLIVYHHNGRWHGATRNGCEAQGECQAGLPFSRLADVASEAHGANSIDDLMGRAGIDRSLTVMFELTAPHNRILVNYDSPSLTLIGVRHREIGKELNPLLLRDALGVPTPRLYQAKDPDDVAELMANWDPREHEGVVAKDAAFRRVKIKAPAYIAAHRMIDSVGTSWRSVVEVIQSGKAEEVASMLSDYHRERIEAMGARIERLVADTERDMMVIGTDNDMKAFAVQANQRKWPAALFAVRRGKAASVQDFLKFARPDHVLEIAGAPGDFDRGHNWQEDE